MFLLAKVCPKPFSYDILSDRLIDRLQAFIPVQLDNIKRQQRSLRWLKELVQLVSRQTTRKCIQKTKPNPSNIPASVFGTDCISGIDDIEMFCEKFENFIIWLLSDCGHTGKVNKLKKRCDKIKSFIN